MDVHDIIEYYINNSNKNETLYFKVENNNKVVNMINPKDKNNINNLVESESYFDWNDIPNKDGYQRNTYEGNIVANYDNKGDLIKLGATYNTLLY